MTEPSAEAFLKRQVEIARRPISDADSAIAGIDVPLHGDVHGEECSAASALSAVARASGSERTWRLEK